MKEVFDFLAEHPWARWTAFTFLMMVIARKPTLRVLRGRMELKAAKLEVSTYEILRKEIQTLTELRVKDQRENRLLNDTIKELEAKIAKQQTTISELTPK